MTSPWRRRGRILLVTAVLLGAALAAWPGGAQAASGSLAPGTRLWVSRFSGSDAGGQATAIAPSFDGSTVFVTGLSRTGPVTQRWVTIAYNAKTGTQRWLTARAAGTAPRAIGVNGTRVFVTGTGPGTTGGFMTIAYDAATGAQLWMSTSSVAASPAAMVVFGNNVLYVTGATAAVDGVSPDYLTIAYNAATGAQQWVSRYDGKAHGTDQAAGIAVAGLGKTVLVTGRSEGKTSGADAATVAYDAATGAQEWVSRYNGAANGDDFGQAIAVNPGGHIAYVTGGSQGKVTGRDLVTIGYSVATGAQLWVRRYNAGGKSSDQGVSVAVFSTGGPLIVTGRSIVAGRPSDVTIAYNGRTGKPVWVRHFTALDNFSFNPVAMVLGGLAAIGYVAGDTGLPSHEEGYGTVAFFLGTGSVVWRGHYAGPAGGKSHVLGLAIGPQTGGTLYETGASDSSDGVSDFATVAYVAR